jgi:hypothetical protein
MYGFCDVNHVVSRDSLITAFTHVRVKQLRHHAHPFVLRCGQASCLERER